jgi:hypothetical protein
MTRYVIYRHSCTNHFLQERHMQKVITPFYVVGALDP